MSFLEVKFYFKLLYIGTVYVEEHFTFHSGLESRAVLYILTTLSRPIFSMTCKLRDSGPLQQYKTLSWVKIDKVRLGLPEPGKSKVRLRLNSSKELAPLGGPGSAGL